MPPQAPSPGQIARSITSTSSRDISPREQAPTASNASMIVTSRLGAVGQLGLAGQDRAGVEEHAARSRRAAAISMPGSDLSQAGQQHRAVEALGLHHGLDAVGDHLAGDQREVHALVAHRDAVGHRDRAELHREAARGEHTVLDGLREPVQRQVARRDLVPRRRDADLRLGEVVVAHAYRAQHSAGGGLLQAVGDVAAAGLHVDADWHRCEEPLARGLIRHHASMPSAVA